MRLLSYVLVGVISAGLTALMFTGGHVAGPSKGLNPIALKLTYSDFVSILLTTLGLILAALAIVIGIVAFRTIGEIKREAVRSVAKAVEEQVREHLPSAIDEAVEKAGREGRLDEALQKAMMMFSAGGGAMNAELQPGFEEANDEEKSK